MTGTGVSSAGAGPTTVLLVDDDALSRGGLAAILSAAPDLVVVGQVDDGDEVPAAVRSLRPQVVLMDLRMRRVGGLEATVELLRHPDPPAVIAMTSMDVDDLVEQCLAAGATTFLSKDVRPAAFVHAVRAAADGYAVVDPQAVRRVVRRTGSSPAAAACVARLTERERQVLVAIADALDNAEIATELFIEETTVKTHVSNVLRKLGARNRVHAAMTAARAGLVAL